MANQPFDQTIINALERPTSSDLNQAQGQAHADVRMLASKLFQVVGTTEGQEGFVGDSFKVVPTSPASMNVQITNGIGFQNGSTETDIGGIAGLTDAYPYKALTISNRIVPIAALPSAGEYRYDLIQVRVPTNTERLANQQSKDIYNPTLNSFNATNVYKTLSSDLTGATIETILYNGTPSGNYQIVYKKGEPATSSPTPPSADAGYLPLAYILVNYATTAISTTQITDLRAILGTTPVYYFALDAVSGNISSTSWTSLGGLTLNKKRIREGLARIRIQPTSDGLLSYFYADNVGASDSSVQVKIQCTEQYTAFDRTFVFSTACPPNTRITIPFPTIEDNFPAGTYNISVSVKCGVSAVTINYDQLVLFVAQG